MSNHPDCVFCKMLKGEVPFTKIYEDDKVLVILDIRPACTKGGHCLVIPKEHYELITELPNELFQHTAVIIKKVGKALLEFGQGFNVLQNNKKVAGQYVPHVHFHLIPRFENDGITLEKWAENRYDSEEHQNKVADQLRKLIS